MTISFCNAPVNIRMGGRFSETCFLFFRCIKMAIVHDIAEGMLICCLLCVICLCLVKVVLHA